MKKFKVLAVLCGLCASVVMPAAHAALGYDTFNPNRGYVLTPSPLALTTIGTVNYSNAPIDKLTLTGIGTLMFNVATNAGAGNTVITATIYSAPDMTNYVQYTNFAVSSVNTIVTTNTYYGSTNLLCTNSVLAAGTYPTVPSAATAGYATPYLLYNPATNQTVSIVGSAPVFVQINLDDINRYVKVLYAISGGSGATNAYVNAVLLGTPSSPGY